MRPARPLYTLTVLSLLIAACSQPVEETTSRQTLPEEVTQQTQEATTTQPKDLGPLPEANWKDTALKLQPLVSLSEPTAMATRPGSPDLWITERSGVIRQVKRSVTTHRPSKRVTNSDGKSVRVTSSEYIQLSNNIVLDIQDKVSSNGEGGLLGLAFSNNGSLLYIHYTDTEGDTVVSKYSIEGDKANAETEDILLTTEQPQSNHNGGQLTRGPDGFLYIGLGDGGGSGDPEGHGQNTQTLLGSILRIDPEAEGTEPYGIPVNNPFATSETNRKELWLWGVRNPWRFSFDSDTGDLWVADVGQNTEEEITVLTKKNASAGRGSNLGWNIQEGNTNFTPGASTDSLVNPFYTYETGSDGTCSIIGGYVYRGELLAFRVNGLVDKPLEGVYIFTDYCSGTLQGVTRLEDGRALHTNLLTEKSPQNVISFGEGPDKELYILEQGGQLSRLDLVESDRLVTILTTNQQFPSTRLPQDQQVLPGEPELQNETTTTKP